MIRPIAAYILVLFTCVATATAYAAEAPLKKKKKTWMQSVAEAAPSNNSVDVAGVRGLKEGETGTGEADLAAIKKLESLAVSDDAVETFVKEGNLQ
jgi:hypothetical protein